MLVLSINVKDQGFKSCIKPENVWGGRERGDTWETGLEMTYEVAESCFLMPGETIQCNSFHTVIFFFFNGIESFLLLLLLKAPPKLPSSDGLKHSTDFLHTFLYE